MKSADNLFDKYRLHLDRSFYGRLNEVRAA